jgi:hypothetical protein
MRSARVFLEFVGLIFSTTKKHYQKVNRGGVIFIDAITALVFFVALGV